ncbi:MAG: 50S ribosomal protein L27 [Minisyncoccales bacterium]|jgi:large subunit ribosomal protein L27
MATTKAAGTSRLGRDSNPKYLGVKLFAGQKAKIGSIIIRQRGSKFIAGNNVRMGSDNTLYAVKAGAVSFGTTRKKKFDGSQRLAKIVNVE